MSSLVMTDDNEECILVCPQINTQEMKVYSVTEDKYLPVLDIDEITVSYETSEGIMEKGVIRSNIQFNSSNNSGSSTEASFDVEFNGANWNLYRFHPGVVKRVLAKNMPIDDALQHYYTKNTSEPIMYPDGFREANRKLIKAIEKICKN